MGHITKICYGHAWKWGITFQNICFFDEKVMLIQWILGLYSDKPCSWLLAFFNGHIKNLDPEAIKILVGTEALRFSNTQTCRYMSLLKLLQLETWHFARCSMPQENPSELVMPCCRTRMTHDAADRNGPCETKWPSTNNLSSYQSNIHLWL